MITYLELISSKLVCQWFLIRIYIARQGIEIDINKMLTQAPQPRPATACKDWSMVLCLSCGQYGHGVGRCPQLDVKFPFMLAGWSAEKIGDHYAMISPHVAAERLRPGNSD